SLDGSLYVFRTGRSKDGAMTVTPLNGGQPLSLSGTLVKVGGVYPVGDGTHAWLAPIAKHGAYQLWTGLWHAHVSESGKVEVFPVNSESHFGKPLRRIFLDERDPEHLWVQTYDLPIYDVRIGATKANQAPFPTSLHIDTLKSSSLPNRIWAATSSLVTFVVGPANDV